MWLTPFLFCGVLREKRKWWWPFCRVVYVSCHVLITLSYLRPKNGREKNLKFALSKMWYFNNFFPFSVSNITIFFQFTCCPLLLLTADILLLTTFFEKKRPWLRKRVSHANAMESPAHVRRIMISFFFISLHSTPSFIYFLLSPLCGSSPAHFKQPKMFFFLPFSTQNAKKKYTFLRSWNVIHLFLLKIFWLVGSLVTCWQQLASFREIGNYTQHDDDAASSSSTFHKFIFFFGGKLFPCLCVIFRRD
jgi:hypothetical protein